MIDPAKLCKRGHPQTPENRVVFPSTPSGCCRRCREETRKAWQAAHRAAAVNYTREWRKRQKEKP